MKPIISKWKNADTKDTQKKRGKRCVIAKQCDQFT